MILEQGKKMKFLFIYYGYLEIGGRAKEIIQSVNNEFEVLAYTLSNSKSVKKLSIYKKIKFYRSKFSFLVFFLEGLYLSLKSRKSIDGVVICDGAATILGTFLIKLGFKDKLIVQDFVEFYETKDFRKRPFSQIVLMFEKSFIKRTDLIVCANNYRSKLMLEKYALINTPHVFENIWSLNSQNEYGSKLENYPHDLTDVKKLRLIYTGVINSSSQFINLLNGALGNLDICHLRIAGRVNTKIIQAIREKTNNNFSNIEFIGLLSHEELRLELKKSHVGLVFYPLDTLNNIYCAPGKLHEYIFEGLPIITSSNPPLREFTEKHGVGMSNDDFAEAIQWMYNNFDDCKRNVKKYISENNNIIMENRMKLSDAIKLTFENKKSKL